MPRLKRIAALGLAGFLAFAPPGTLIVLAALLFGLLGRSWLLLGLCSLVVLAGLAWLAWRWAMSRE